MNGGVHCATFVCRHSPLVDFAPRGASLTQNASGENIFTAPIVRSHSGSLSSGPLSSSSKSTSQTSGNGAYPGHSTSPFSGNLTAIHPVFPAPMTRSQ